MLDQHGFVVDRAGRVEADRSCFVVLITATTEWRKVEACGVPKLWRQGILLTDPVQIWLAFDVGLQPSFIGGGPPNEAC